MWLRLFLYCFAVPMLIVGAVTASMGTYVIPYEVRAIFPISWAAENPTAAFYGSVVIVVLALLMRPSQRVVLVNDFAH